MSNVNSATEINGTHSVTDENAGAITDAQCEPTLKAIGTPKTETLLKNIKLNTG